ncbi:MULTISPECIES: hypothetical protein [Sphingomonas]|uniref:hypothetical protein n=1 Tax=Sphingomonas TaxID=13687 RepID=UPI000DF01B95|nr:MULTISPECIES: hypothetical protein [Sphingomonas]
MSYRQSTYDPLAPAANGPPLKPFNWVQWCGVAMAALGVVGSLLWLGAVTGLVPAWGKDFVRFGLIGTFGIILINTRRADVPPEERVAYRAKQRRQSIIMLVIIGVASVAAFIFAFLSKGA